MKSSLIVLVALLSIAAVQVRINHSLEAEKIIILFIFRVNIALVITQTSIKVWLWEPKKTHLILQPIVT